VTSGQVRSGVRAGMPVNNESDNSKNTHSS